MMSERTNKGSRGGGWIQAPVHRPWDGALLRAVDSLRPNVWVKVARILNVPVECADQGQKETTSASNSLLDECIVQSENALRPGLLWIMAARWVSSFSGGVGVVFVFSSFCSWFVVYCCIPKSLLLFVQAAPVSRRHPFIYSPPSPSFTTPPRLPSAHHHVPSLPLPWPKPWA